MKMAKEALLIKEHREKKVYIFVYTILGPILDVKKDTSNKVEQEGFCPSYSKNHF